MKTLRILSITYLLIVGNIGAAQPKQTYPPNLDAYVDTWEYINDTLLIEEGKHTYFCVKKDGVISNVRNIENQLFKDDKFLCHNISVSKNTTLISSSIASLFSKDRIIELKEKLAIVTLWVDRNGTVKEVDFYFHGKEGMTLSFSEAITLEDFIKNNMKISYISEDDKDCTFAKLTAPIKFNKLLELK